MTNEFADYISSALNSFIVQEHSSDLVLRKGENELVYVDVEHNSLYLITIKEAEAQAPQVPDAD